MSKRIKKAFAILMALVMVFAMSATAFASADAGEQGYEIVGSPTTYTNPITVKVVVQSRERSVSNQDSINTAASVSVSPNSDGNVSVRDAMLAFNALSSNSVKAYNSSGNILSANDGYIYSFKKGTVDYAPQFTSNHGDGNILCDGWMFRVNGKIPVSSVDSTYGPYGTTIVDTYLKDGDVLFFYTDYPWKENGQLMSSYYIDADISYTNGTVAVQLVESYNWYADKAQNYFWTISPFANKTSIKANTQVKIIDVNGNSVGNITVGKTTGYGSKAITLTAGQTYYFYTMNQVTDNKTVTVNGTTGRCLDTTRVYTKFVA